MFDLPIQRSRTPRRGRDELPRSLRASAWMLAWCLASCTETKPPLPSVAPLPPEPTDPATPRGSAREGGGAALPKPRPPGCGPEGTTWNGKLGPHCLYEVHGCCYPSPEAACSAVDCAATRCQIIETSPAQVVCRPEGGEPSSR